MRFQISNFKLAMHELRMRGTFGGRSLFPPPVLRERAREGGFQRQTYLLKCCDAAGTTACFPHRHEPFALERRPATCDASHVCRASAQCRRTADPPVKTHAPLPNLPRRTACHYPQLLYRGCTLKNPPPYPPPEYLWREKRARDLDLWVMTRA